MACKWPYRTENRSQPFSGAGTFVLSFMTLEMATTLRDVSSVRMQFFRRARSQTASLFKGGFAIPENCKMWKAEY